MKKLITIVLTLTLLSCSTEEVNREQTGFNIDNIAFGNYWIKKFDYLGNNVPDKPYVKIEQDKITIYQDTITNIREEITEGEVSVTLTQNDTSFEGLIVNQNGIEVLRIYTTGNSIYYVKYRNDAQKETVKKLTN